MVEGEELVRNWRFGGADGAYLIGDRGVLIAIYKSDTTSYGDEFRCHEYSQEGTRFREQLSVATHHMQVVLIVKVSIARHAGKSNK